MVEDLQLRGYEDVKRLDNAVSTLYGNLAKVFGNYVHDGRELLERNDSSNMHSGIYRNLSDSMNYSSHRNELNPPEDKIRDLIGIFEYVAQFVPKDFRTMFEGYREGEKVNGTYLDDVEVNQFCSEDGIERRILEALK
jgi:hypothetical protein